MSARAAWSIALLPWKSCWPDCAMCGRRNFCWGLFHWICSPCCWAGDGADADLCEGNSAYRSARAGPAACCSCGGGAYCFHVAYMEAHPAALGCENAHLRGDLWNSHGGVWVVEECVALACGIVLCGRLGHGQRGHPFFHSATRHTAGDARPCQRREFTLYWRLQ